MGNAQHSPTPPPPAPINYKTKYATHHRSSVPRATALKGHRALPKHPGNAPKPTANCDMHALHDHGLALFKTALGGHYHPRESIKPPLPPRTTLPRVESIQPQLPPRNRSNNTKIKQMKKRGIRTKKKRAVTREQ